MLKITTDYGLIYNTDGSVCTTVRPDQTPFPGVNSFAVETATTNLVTNSPQQPSFALQTNAQATRSIVTSGNLAGWVKINVTQIGLGSLIGWFGGTIVHPKEQTRTYAIDAILPPNFNFMGYVQGNIGTLQKISDYRYSITWTNTTGVDKNGTIYLRSTLPEGATGSWDVYVRNYQIEQKPFATSFVDGSRPKGRFEISVEDLKFDIANDDWVISYWKYPVGTSDDTQNGYNVCSLGQYISDRSKGYMWWGKASSTNKYCVLVLLNDAASIKILSDNTFDPNWYFRNWHYEVLKKQGKVLSYYVDGVKQCEATIPANKELQTPFDVGLNLGGHTYNNVFYPANALIAALYYGYNSATWTDLYIQEMLNTKLPYVAKSKPLVI